MSYGEHVLLAEVVVEQKAANCTQERQFLFKNLIFPLFFIYLFIFSHYYIILKLIILN